MSISVGLGSWTDREYTGILFPKGTVATNRLATYAQVFDRVEVNSTYYTTLRSTVAAEWVKQTPAGFLFDIKLHRVFSLSPEKGVRESDLPRYLLDGVQPLVRAKKLGVFLLVAAPTFRPERNRLEQLDLLVEILKPHILAVELRHNEWVAGKNRTRTLEFFRERRLVWVCVDMPRIKHSSVLPPMDEVTNPNLGYMRLHGRNKGWLKAKSAADRHRYEYPARQVREIAARVRRLAENAEHVHVVANNHAADFAPKMALALQRILKLSGRAGSAGPRSKSPALAADNR